MPADPTRGEAQLPEALLQGASAEERERLFSALRIGEIRKRQDGGDIFVRSGMVPRFVLLKPLQRTDGPLRADARRTLIEADNLLDEPQAQGTVDYMAQIEETYGRYLPTQLHSLSRDLLAHLDSVAVLTGHLALPENEGMSLYRVVTTPALHARDVFWRLVTAAQTDGQSISQFAASGEWPRPDSVSGGVVAQAARWAAAPLLARSQPVAAVFMTSWGAEILALARGSWIRPGITTGWPTGFGGLVLTGTGQGIYAGRHTTIDRDMPKRLAEALLDGANSLIGLLTDPGEWADSNGELDSVERMVAWSTVDLGLSTITEMGRNWASAESVWTAFRALGVLQGYWQGVGRGDVLLQDLLYPDVIRTVVLSAVPDTWYRGWVEDIVGNYEDALLSMYPGETIEVAVDRVADLRNLVHGTGVDRAAHRGRRLEALRGVGREGGLALMKDIAAFWWLSVVASPSTHGRTGDPPSGLSAWRST